MREAELVELLTRVADSPPASRAAAEELEAALAEATNIVAVDEFAEALNLYEPTDSPGPNLIGFDGLRASAREALHELGRHERCLHDVPLTDRP